MRGDLFLSLHGGGDSRPLARRVGVDFGGRMRRTPTRAGFAVSRLPPEGEEHRCC